MLAAEATAMTLLITLLRIGLFLWGLALIGGGFEAIFWPEILFSDADTRASRGVEWAMAVGAIGYGALLVLSPRLLTRVRWLIGLLVGLVGVFAVSLLFSGPSGGFDSTRILGTLVRVSPAALALIFVLVEAKRCCDSGYALDPGSDAPLVSDR